jgi:molybdopterin-synthase adenylyltransferase
MTDSLRLDDEDRFERLRLIPWWNQERLLSARVMVVGAGAIGNEVLKNLALVGVGTIQIVDMDTIENSNLTRSTLFRLTDVGKPKVHAAAEEVSRICPNTKVIATQGNVLCDVGLGDFAAADIILGCLDNREARLWVNRCCWRVGRPWLDAGIQEIDGVIQAFAARQSPCYECGLKDMDYKLIQLRYSCLHLSQDELVLGRVPTSPTIASIVAGWQTQMAVKFLHDQKVHWGTALVVNGWQETMYRTELPTKDECLSHDAWQVDMHLEDSYRHQPVKQVLRAASLAFGLGNPATLILEREFIESLKCPNCAEVVPVRANRWKVDPSIGTCQRCNLPRVPNILYRIEQDSEWNDLTLAELGVPSSDWVQVLCDDKLHVIGFQPAPP